MKERLVVLADSNTTLEEKLKNCTHQPGLKHLLQADVFLETEDNEG